MAFEFTDANFEDSAIKSKGIAVVDFWAEWCGPCRMVTPIIEKLAGEYTDGVTIGKLNVDDNSEVSARYAIRSIPTILIFKDGEVVDRHVGMISKAALQQKIDMHRTAEAN